MTTAEFIVCNVLGCGELDIETMFGEMTDSGLFYDAYHSLIDNGCHADARTIWSEGIRIAIEKVFGEEYLDDFEIDPNYMACSVAFLGDKDSIIDFDEKVAKFSEMTGFEPSY